MTAFLGNKSLPQLQQAAYAAIDAAAETCREQFITPGYGQSMSYVQKAAEAVAFLAQYPTQAAAPAAPDPTNWPWMSAEVGITASDMWGVATVIAGLARQFTAAGSAIESLRLGAKVQVGAATTPDAIAAAQVIAWPTPPAGTPST